MANTKPYQCFKLTLPQLDQHRTSEWFNSWQAEFTATDLSWCTSTQLNALGRLVPLLLCGEQSAQLVFGQEINSNKNNEIAVQGLKSIESDEYFHDLALQDLLTRLPQPQDLNQIKRRAQKFYCLLSKTEDIKQHFARIRHLDSCVTIIMSAMAKSNLGKEHIISKLFQYIQKDEARHVKVCSDYIRQLGGDNQLISSESRMIKQALVTLLRTEQQAFNDLGVNSSILFSRILK